jgi:hypothetical protein
VRYSARSLFVYQFANIKYSPAWKAASVTLLPVLPPLQLPLAAPRLAPALGPAHLQVRSTQVHVPQINANTYIQALALALLLPQLEPPAALPARPAQLPLPHQSPVQQRQSNLVRLSLEQQVFWQRCSLFKWRKLGVVFDAWVLDLKNSMVDKRVKS